VAGEIEVVMVAAPRVEGGMARGANRVAFEIGGDCQLGAAGSAENGLEVPFGLGPDFNRMAREGIVAILAGVVDAAAFHFDRDDVERGVVMEAAGLGIEVQAEDFGGE
jgi:hypothetical protein